MLSVLLFRNKVKLCELDSYCYIVRNWKENNIYFTALHQKQCTLQCQSVSHICVPYCLKRQQEQQQLKLKREKFQQNIKMSVNFCCLFFFSSFIFPLLHHLIWHHNKNKKSVHWFLLCLFLQQYIFIRDRNEEKKQSRSILPIVELWHPFFGVVQITYLNKRIV